MQTHSIEGRAKWFLVQLLIAVGLGFLGSTISSATQDVPAKSWVYRINTGQASGGEFPSAEQACRRATPEDTFLRAAKDAENRVICFYKHSKEGWEYNNHLVDYVAHCPENARSEDSGKSCTCESNFEVSGEKCVAPGTENKIADTSQPGKAASSVRCPEKSSRDALGDVVIQSQLQAPSGRQGFEKQLLRGIEVGLPGWQRAHSQGQGTGRESANAILYAPEEVNQEYQNSGIEKYLRELYRSKPRDVEVCLTTVTAAHPRSLRLKEIQYRVEVLNKENSSRILFEASIEVADKRDKPRVSVQAKPSGTW